MWFNQPSLNPQGDFTSASPSKPQLWSLDTSPAWAYHCGDVVPLPYRPYGYNYNDSLNFVKLIWVYMSLTRSSI